MLFYYKELEDPAKKALLEVDLRNGNRPLGTVEKDGQPLKVLRKLYRVTVSSICIVKTASRRKESIPLKNRHNHRASRVARPANPNWPKARACADNGKSIEEVLKIIKMEKFTALKNLIASAEADA